MTASDPAADVKLTIIGASARAAAESARRAGLVPWCADLFADSDLCAIAAEVVRCPIEQYPHGFLEILRRSPDCPWMYTGGLENHPELIRRMANIRPLWGNGPEALIACRSPEAVARILGEAGLPVPEIRGNDTGSPMDRTWLRKPRAGSAGMGIAVADPSRGGQSGTHYVQQFIPGPAMSVVYARTCNEMQLLGVSEQLVGTDRLNAPPFRYAGSIGPVAVAPELERDLTCIGKAIGDQCGLLGLFGVDFILNAGRPWVVEVNPRYPASVEVFERATRISAIDSHRAAFGGSSNSNPEAGARATGSIRTGPVVGKAILYARRKLTLDTAHSWNIRGLAKVTLADIPSPGQSIEEGWPVLTVLTQAQSPEACRRRLFKATAVIDQQLFGARSAG